MNDVQKHMFCMLLEVDKICKKHNINYYLEGGTFLGAIRHNGFIPWDDDLDIMMLREDYEKFIKVAQIELGEKYFLQTEKTDKHYGYIFAKIRENNTIYQEKNAINNKSHNGLFIDIFPIDYISDNKFKANYLLYKIIFLRMLLLIKCNYTIDNNTIIKKICIMILKTLSVFTTRKRILKRINNIINKNNKKSNTLVLYSSVYFNKSFFKAELFKEKNLYLFEENKFSGVKNYDEYLTYLYGDYMTPPSESNRNNRHGIINIKLNKNK